MNSEGSAITPRPPAIRMLSLEESLLDAAFDPYWPARKVLLPGEASSTSSETSRPVPSSTDTTSTSALPLSRLEAGDAAPPFLHKLFKTPTSPSGASRKITIRTKAYTPSDNTVGNWAGKDALVPKDVST